jgi:hypothetical protein
VFGRVGAILLASLLGAMVLGAEAALGIILLGKFFERYDVTSEA